MECLSPSDIINKYVEADELDGFCAMYSGTFGGRLLRDADTDAFYWFSDQEYDDAMNQVTRPSQLIQAHRSICDDE